MQRHHHPFFAFSIIGCTVLVQGLSGTFWKYIIFGGVPLVCPQGNKRTPERFVGREAVITTQCLNGWYLSLPLPLHPSLLMQLWKKMFLPQVEDHGWVEES